MSEEPISETDGSGVSRLGTWTVGSWRLAIERLPIGRAKLRSAYDRIAPRWHDRLRLLQIPAAYQELLSGLHRSGRLAVLEDGSRVLDVGIGSGVMTRALSEVAGHPLRVDGVDLSARMLDQAAARLEDLDGTLCLQTGSIHELPFADNRFDMVMAAHVLEHQARPQPALRELRRVLKPEGRLLLMLTRSTWLGMLIHLRWRVHLWEPEEVYRQLEEAGFADALSFHVSGSFWGHWSSLAYLAGP